MNDVRDARVLVIGGLGFLGVNLTQSLINKVARLTVLTPDRSRHADDAATLEREGVAVVEGDLRDQPLMETLVADQSLVLNVAGQSGAVRSMQDPWTDLDVNLRGNLVLLEALRARNPGAKVVFAGSRLQYGHVDDLPVKEDATRAPLCLYAIHKQTVEEYLALYSRLFGIRYSVARITNPYGPGQPSSTRAYGVINRMIQLAIDGRAITIYGDGLQQRDYIHIDDVVNALRDLAFTAAADGGVYNVGTGRGTKMIDLAAKITGMAGSGRIEHVEWPALARQVETGDFVPDISRIYRDIGWQPAVGLEDGLARTIAFYRRVGAA